MSENEAFSPGSIFIAHTKEALSSSFESYAAFITDTFYSEIFKGNIRLRQVLEVTGDSPLPSAQLKALLRKLGFDEYIAPNGQLWDDLTSEWPVPYADPPLLVIVGRENFDRGVLRMTLSDYFEEGIVNTAFWAQEDFINYWLFGIEPQYIPNDPRIENHPGLKFLASFSQYPWPWPLITASPSTGEFDNSNLEDEHLLKARFGYSVAQDKNYTDAQRQRILDDALNATTNALELKEIVYHIAWLIRTRKNINSRNFSRAITKWETDLNYLKQTYYRRQFKWPRTDVYCQWS
jgi:hypothetical protein